MLHRLYCEMKLLAAYYLTPNSIWNEKTFLNVYSFLIYIY